MDMIKNWRTILGCGWLGLALRLSRERMLGTQRLRAMGFSFAVLAFVRGLPLMLIAALSSAASQASAPPLVSPNAGASGTPAPLVLDQPPPDAPNLARPAPARPANVPAVFSRAVPASMVDLRNVEQHVEALVGRVSPAVVAVEVGFGSGSGVIISADGLVLTAGHVCGAANRDVRFTFPDGRSARGKTVGLDADSDTGLMRITDAGPWPHVPLGDLDSGRAGDWVLALGHPGGFDQQRSLVVRLGRIIQIDPDALQTDCTISPGDSGGPLFDMSGRVIGIHSAISGSLAANYHVPINQFVDAWNALTQGAVAARPAALRAYFGATARNETAGCVLGEVEKNGPAAKAGLKAGDVVLAVEGRAIKAAASLQRWLAESAPGEILKVQIQRGESKLTLPVKLEAAPKKK